MKKLGYALIILCLGFTLALLLIAPNTDSRGKTTKSTVESVHQNKKVKAIRPERVVTQDDGSVVVRTKFSFDTTAPKSNGPTVVPLSEIPQGK